MWRLVVMMGLAQVAAASEPALQALVGAAKMRPASVGVCVLPLDDTGEAVAWQAERVLIPASTMKVVTTATALQLLGPDFVFETHAFFHEGDLIIKGGGDPTFAATSLTKDFQPWIKALKEGAVTEIPGDLIVDPSRFEEKRAPNEWPSGDVGNYYGAGPSGMNYHLNAFEVTFAPGEVGRPAKLVRVWPEPPGVEFINHMQTGPRGSGDQGYLYGGPGAKVMTLRGTIPQGPQFSIRGALPDPARMCGEVLKDELARQGIALSGEVRVATMKTTEMIPLAKTTSPSLLKIIKGTNHRSVNLYADSMFKALTPAGTTQAAVAKIRSHWQAQGVDLRGCVMHDGSGMSPRGVISSRQLAMILKKARGHETGAAFLSSLPVAGKAGTMATFGRGTQLVGAVRAKSGSMTGVRSYAGYLTARSGREFAFAVLVNNALSSPKGDIASFLAKLMNDL